MNRPELEGKVPAIEDTGCCEDLKASAAYIDQFVLKKYFAVPVGKPLPESNLKQSIELE